MIPRGAYHKIAAQAAANPTDFKVCALCGCIVEKTILECRYCDAYHFIEDEDYVSNVALDHACHHTSAILELEEVEKD